MDRFAVFFLLTVFPSSPLFAQTQTMSVPNLATLGFLGATPEPAELDGNTQTLEFVVYAGDGRFYAVNPTRTMPFSTIPCRELIPYYGIARPDQSFVFQTLRTINNRTHVMTWGFDTGTWEYPYDLRPVPLPQCLP